MLRAALVVLRVKCKCSALNDFIHFSQRKRYQPTSPTPTALLAAISKNNPGTFEQQTAFLIV